MKSEFAQAFGAPLTIDVIPIPTPEPGQALVKIAACSVFHAHLHAGNATVRWQTGQST